MNVIDPLRERLASAQAVQNNEIRLSTATVAVLVAQFDELVEVAYNRANSSECICGWIRKFTGGELPCGHCRAKAIIEKVNGQDVYK